MPKEKPKFFMFQLFTEDRANLELLAKRMRCSQSAATRSVLAQAAEALRRKDKCNQVRSEH